MPASREPPSGEIDYGRARREVLEFDWPVADAVAGALGLPEREPDAGHALRGRLHGLHSLRVGSYRVIYQLTEEAQVVRILAVRHRGIGYLSGPR